MESLATYLKKKAAECHVQANYAVTEGERVRWFKMASLFLNQAQQFE
jgi:hypothetical protein